jgi:hydroxylamine reductase (hybrid-cluster protein)
MHTIQKKEKKKKKKKKRKEKKRLGPPCFGGGTEQKQAYNEQMARATRPQCGSAGVTSLTERCTLSTGGCKKKYIYTDHALVLVQEKVKRYTTERVFDT